MREKKEGGVHNYYVKTHGFSRLSNVQVDNSSIQHPNACSLGVLFDSRNATGVQRER
jgi:hypothetical protein